MKALLHILLGWFYAIHCSRGLRISGPYHTRQSLVVATRLQMEPFERYTAPVANALRCRESFVGSLSFFGH